MIRGLWGPRVTVSNDEKKKMIQKKVLKYFLYHILLIFDIILPVNFFRNIGKLLI